MPVSQRLFLAVLVSTLTVGVPATVQAAPIEPFVQVDVNGEVHRVAASFNSAFCGRLPCVAGLIELNGDAATVRVVGVMSPGVDPLAPQYGHNQGAWSVRLYVEATNLSADPLTIVAWAGTPLSPLFLFPGPTQLVPTQAATYYSYLTRVLSPGGPDPDIVGIDPLFPDLDGDGDAEMLNALAAKTPGGPFQSLGIDLGTGVSGAGFANVPAATVFAARIDPAWVALSSALAFTLTGGGDRVQMRGDVSIVPAAVPEPTMLGLVGLGLLANALRHRHRSGGSSRVFPRA
ncbi:PEP-CTERM sorting domain-containing protein [Luteitalea sp.]